MRAMAEFGKRKSKPSVQTGSVTDRQETPTDQRAPLWSGILKISLAGVFCAFGLLVLFNQAAFGVLKSRLISPSHRSLTVSFQDNDMYTGAPPISVHASFEDNSGEHPEDKRLAERLHNDAITRCHASLKKDIARRTRQGESGRDVEENASIEPLLNDLGFYLPCLMSVHKRRFCSPNQKKDLVRRIEAYLTVLHTARNTRPRAPKAAPNGLNHVFLRINAEFGGDHNDDISFTPKSVSLNADARLVAALEDLIALGYLDLADFAAFFGLYVPSDIQLIFTKVKKQQNSCGA